MQILENASLKSLNTFSVDSNAKYFVQLNTEDDLYHLLDTQAFQNNHYLILGGGSNVLFCRNFAGIVLHVKLRGIELVGDDDTSWYVKAAAGENWHQFVLHCVEKQYYGLENLSLIPGTVGAAPVQNIGAYGVELADYFYELQAMDMQTGDIVAFDREAMQFGYRDSFFKQADAGKYCILSVTFSLSKTPAWRLDYHGVAAALAHDGKNKSDLTSKRVSEAICYLRRKKLPDPAVLGNAGSFFKNPLINDSKRQQLKQDYPNLSVHSAGSGQYKLSAAWLIDQCGWKGRREGDAGVSPEHALVLVNYGKASGENIWQLAQAVQASVEAHFGVQLEPEPKVIL